MTTARPLRFLSPAALLLLVTCADPTPPPPPVASVDVSPNTAEVGIGQNAQLTAKVKDAAGNALLDRPVTWTSSSPAIATVSATGLVTGLRADTARATITATCEGVSGSASIGVQPPAVASVTVDPAAGTVLVGDTVRLGAIVRDSSGQVLTDRAVTWTSSAPAIATVSATGLVTAARADAQLATITATSEGVSGAAVITVSARPPLVHTTLAAGSGHTCALSGTGAAFCWGYNGSGQLGNGSFTNSTTPVAVSGGRRFSALSSTGYHTCGLTSAGAAYCWGGNWVGQLGDGSTASTAVPVAVSGGLRFSAVATGMMAHTCGLTTVGVAYCWGDNVFGELGNGSTTNSSTPVAVSTALRFRAIAAGTDHTCALTIAGAAYCWGENGHGQLGNGSTTNSTTPIAVAGTLTFSALAAGGYVTCALTGTGAAHCWGESMDGELGTGLPGSDACFIPCSVVPAAVAGGLTFSGLAHGGAYHHCGFTSAGAAYCWGRNTSGQLGAGSTTNSSVPVAVSNGLSFSAVATGGDHTCGFSVAGAVYCWGHNSAGQLGDGTTTNRLSPVAVAGGLTLDSLVTVTAVNPVSGPLAGGTSLTITGTTFVNVTSVTVGGSELIGVIVASPTQITGTTAARASPGAQDVIVTSSTNGRAVCGGCFTYVVSYSSVATGAYHSCGRAADGAAYCWGYGGFGQLGTGTKGGALTPIAVAGGLTLATLSVGGVHNCGLTAAGDAFCWGSDAFGELGTGTPGPETCTATEGNFPCSAQPLAVAGGVRFTSLSAGYGVVCGLDSGGAAHCWGDNAFGALGIGGDTTNLSGCTFGPCSRTPLAVSGGLSFGAIGAGVWHACGLTAAGAAYCWGDNRYGQLGLGTATAPDQCGSTPCNRTPLPVTGGLTFTTLRVGTAHSCGLASDGAWYCWGSNPEGRLGNEMSGPELCQGTAGDLPCSTRPVAVAGGVGFTNVFPGGYDGCGVDSGAWAYCWGDNGNGQLGDGTTTSSLAPVAVTGGLTFASISPHVSHTCGVTTADVAYCWGRNDLGQLGNGTTTNFAAPVRVAGQSGTAATATLSAGAVLRSRGPLPATRPLRP